MKNKSIGCALGLLICLSASTSFAHARKVGLGVALGGTYSPTELREVEIGSSMGLGFFVDIPLLETFYISPSTTLRRANLGKGEDPATDIDLNFKFIVPLGRLSIGTGVLGGITAADSFYAHYGALGYVSFNPASNLEVFVLAQFKQLIHDSGQPINDVHAYAGSMFRF